MRYFVMVTRMASEAVTSPQALEDLEKQAMAKVREQCPDVEWVQSFAVLGPYDYVDVFRAPDIETAQKVSV
ncbi:MAG: GYD domain-containing protein, partial [Gammaproteobacteria bacterium]|nr:GYD domain-containing protein [Gammaproteobacteria bacterium]